MSANMNLKSRMLLAAALAGTSALAAAGCGQTQSTVGKQQAPVVETVPSAQLPQFPESPVGTTYQGIESLSAQTKAALLGSYTGTMRGPSQDLFSEELQGQAYAMKLSEVQVQGQTQKVAMISLQSDGALGKIELSAYAMMGLSGYVDPYANTTYYSFHTNAVTVTALSELPIAVELIIGLKNGTQIDPTQSKISIKDCGFSQGQNCAYDLPGYGFDLDLRKL